MYVPCLLQFHSFMRVLRCSRPETSSFGGAIAYLSEMRILSRFTGCLVTSRGLLTAGTAKKERSDADILDSD